MTDRFDIVVFGATGRLGTQVVRRLASLTGSDRGIRWAIAGRRQASLEALAAKLSGEVGVLSANVADGDSLRRLAGAARVVLNLAGPFAAYGEPVVAACIDEGTHYLDISGETAHVRRLIDRYHDAAKRARIRIVPFCGFDSVPSDLGVLLLAEYFRDRGVSLRETKGFFRIVSRLNSGTVATTRELWNRSEDVEAMDDPFLLDPQPRSATERLRNADPMVPVLDPDLGRWVGPLWTSAINTRVVRRSRALAADWGADYGRGFRYQEFWDPGGIAPLFAAGIIAWGMATYRIFARLPGCAEWLGPLNPTDDDFPCDSVGDGGYFRALFVGHGDDGSKCWAEIADQGDPSNQATVKIVCECALAMASDSEELPGGGRRGGVLTPATAFGLRLVHRMRGRDVRLRCPI